MPVFRTKSRPTRRFNDVFDVCTNLRRHEELADKELVRKEEDGETSGERETKEIKDEGVKLHTTLDAASSQSLLLNLMTKLYT